MGNFSIYSSVTKGNINIEDIKLIGCVFLMKRTAAGIGICKLLSSVELFIVQHGKLEMFQRVNFQAAEKENGLLFTCLSTRGRCLHCVLFGAC